MKTVSINLSDAIWRDKFCSMFIVGKDYLLYEHSTGDGRWMGKREATRFMNINNRSNHANKTKE